MTHTQDSHAMPDILAMLDEIRRQNDAILTAKQQPGQDFHTDVLALIAEIRRLKLDKGGLGDKVDTVITWFEQDPPTSMGWVGKDGRP